MPHRFTLSRITRPSAVRACLLAAMASLPLAAPASAVSVGMLTDFEDGLTAGWLGSGMPSVMSEGGRTFLRATSFGGSGPGSHMAVHNFSTWRGNYQAGGVTSVQVDIANFGNAAMFMRAVLHGTDGTRFTSTIGQDVPADGVWRTYTFSLAESDLTRVLQSASYASVITNVDRLMFRHDASTPSSGGSSIATTAGYDNIRAIPAPGAAMFAVIGGAWLSAGNRRRRRGA